MSYGSFEESVLDDQHHHSARFDQQGSDAPENLIIFIRDQVKPEDLWLPREWAAENLPTRQWLVDNGLSFTNSFTNTAMCSVSRSTFFTSKFPAQHQADLLLSDIDSSYLNDQVQLNPDFPNLATILKDQGYDVSFFGKAHLSKTFTLNDGEVVYQDMNAYGFDDWVGPDAGQDMKPENAGGGPNDNDGRFTSEAKQWLQNRIQSDNEKPYALVVSLVNPHDVLSYPKTYNTDFEYDRKWIHGDIEILPPTVDEDKEETLKPSVQRQWMIPQNAGQPMPTDKMKLNYLNFYGNLMKRADWQMGEILDVIRDSDNPDDVNNTMIVSTSDHGEMGMSHGGMVQKMFNAYDESLKVPMIWSNPSYFKGSQESDALISLIDFLPTYANFQDFSEDYIAQQDLRGVDYSSILRRAREGESKSLEGLDVQDSILYTYDDIYAGQDPALCEDPVHGLLPAANRIQAVRTKDFKYARYYSGDQDYEPANWEGELYDLRPEGGDYYPDIDPITGQLNPFRAAPLEVRNLDPKAETRRRLLQRFGIGDGPIATKKQKKAYLEMSELLDQQIADRLQPLPESDPIKPSIFVYQGGSSGDQSAYKVGDSIVRFIPNSEDEKGLELAFNTRYGQTYNLVYSEQRDPYASYTYLPFETIIGTNGPTYQYLPGLSAEMTLDQIYIQWSEGFVPLA